MDLSGMTANHIHDALARVRKLQEIILAKRFFGGYSGRARFLSGCTAIIGAMLLSKQPLPEEPLKHLWGWGIVLGLSLLVNYGTLLYWFLMDKDADRNPRQLKPALYALPAFAVGAVFSFLFVQHALYDFLPGMWMCLYGLAQVAYRQTLPPSIYYIGVGYILFGTYFLIFNPQPFTSPWPMGMLFFVGETLGGWYLLNDKADKEETL